MLEKKDDDALLDSVMKAEDVQFFWSLIMFEVDAKLSLQLQHKVVESYVTVRGFAFATSCVINRRHCKQ